MSTTAKNESLVKKVEELQSTEQSGSIKLQNITKENKLLEEKLATVQATANETQQKLTAEKQKNTEIEAALKEKENSVVELQKAVASNDETKLKLVQYHASEKESLRREMQDSLNMMTRERDYMRIEKDEIQKEKELLIESLKSVAEWSQSMLLLYERKQSAIDSMVSKHDDKFKSLRAEIDKLHENVNHALAIAQQREIDAKREIEAQKLQLESAHSKSGDVLGESAKKIAQLEDDLRQSKESIKDVVAAAVEAQESKRQVLEMKLENLNHVIETLEADAEKTSHQKDEQDKAFADLEKRIAQLKAQLSDKDSIIRDLKAKLKTANDLSDQLDKHAKVLKQQISMRDKMLMDMKDKVKEDANLGQEHERIMKEIEDKDLATKEAIAAARQSKLDTTEENLEFEDSEEEEPEKDKIESVHDEPEESNEEKELEITADSEESSVAQPEPEPEPEYIEESKPPIEVSSPLQIQTPVRSPIQASPVTQSPVQPLVSPIQIKVPSPSAPIFVERKPTVQTANAWSQTEPPPAKVERDVQTDPPKMTRQPTLSALSEPKRIPIPEPAPVSKRPDIVPVVELSSMQPAVETAVVASAKEVPAEVEAVDHIEEAKEEEDDYDTEEDTDLFIPKSRVEEIVHKSLVTYNLYYSEEEAAFTSQYPIDKRFLDSLVTSFDKICQKACVLTDTVHSLTGKTYEMDQLHHPHHHHHTRRYTKAVMFEIENFLEFCAKRLIIDFERSKAYSIAKMLESLEDGSTSIERLQRSNSNSDLNDFVESNKEPAPKLNYIARANEVKNIAKKDQHSRSSWNSLRQLLASHAFRYQKDNKKQPAMLKVVNNLMRLQKLAKDNNALSESEQTYLDSIENVSVTLDIHVSEDIAQLRKELKEGKLIDMGRITRCQ